RTTSTRRPPDRDDLPRHSSPLHATGVYPGRASKIAQVGQARLAWEEVGLRSNPGEGPRLSQGQYPVTRIASCDAIRPLPMGEVFTPAHVLNLGSHSPHRSFRSKTRCVSRCAR